MSEPLVGLIGIVILFVLLFLRMPIGFAMALVGFGGFAVLGGINGALANLAVVPFRIMTSYALAVIPLFVLMGIIAANTGIASNLYSAAYKWVGNFRGGLALATILACGGFAAMTGSALAGTATMGKIVAPEMKKYNYDPKLAAGSVAAGGTLGILIPPSTGFILYGILTEQSIGRLFMAGVFPGILEIVFYMCVIFILCRINPAMGPAGPRTSFKIKFTSLGGALPMIVLFIIVMGGIYGGIFTPTEAGGIGAFGAIAISLVLRKLSRGNFFASLVETAQVTAMVLMLIIGAFIFGYFLAITRLPSELAEMLANLDLPSYAILSIFVFVYILLGCFFDVLSIIVLTLPIIFPVVVALGYDPIWFGVIMVRVLEVGAITPPIGIGTYVTARIMDIPTGTAFRGIAPFAIADLFHIALLIAVPQISLFLPNAMKGA